MAIIKQICVIIVLVFIVSFARGQSDSGKTKRIGIIGSFDLAYNFKDKVLNPGLGRKWIIGISFTNKKRQSIVFAGIGIKGFKINLYSPTFRKPFINEIKQNYIPINGTGEDSLVGAKMNSLPGSGLSGTYSQYFELGFILNKKVKPALSLCIGNEEFLLHDHGFTRYEDPEHGDIDYVGMRTVFYEFKLGCAFPFDRFSQKPFCLNLNVGYKYVDYGSLKFNNTPLSAYTKGALGNKYHTGGKLTISLSFILWSNWK